MLLGDRVPVDGIDGVAGLWETGRETGGFRYVRLKGYARLCLVKLNDFVFLN